jgi:predicted DNA-binding WGR domain protein
MTASQACLTSRWTTDNRYYVLRVQTDLFGEWELLKCWGGRRSRLGRHQVVPAQHREHALDLFQRECRRRQRRGYLPSPPRSTA